MSFLAHRDLQNDINIFKIGKVRERVVSGEAQTRTNEVEITVLQPTLKLINVC